MVKDVREGESGELDEDCDEEDYKF